VRAWDKTSVNKLGQQKVFYNVGLLGLQLLLLLLCAKLEVEIKKTVFLDFYSFQDILCLYGFRDKKREESFLFKFISI
jgi:hypothetical protein